MPSRSDSAFLWHVEEAAIVCEAAERDFEAISEEVQKTVRESLRLTEETLLERDRARRRLVDARVSLSHELQRRDAKSVTACYCKGRLWVCERHPAVALDECRCAAASVPCSCNPYRSAPPGYDLQSWTRPRSIHSRPAKHREIHWHDVSGPIRPGDGEQILVRQRYDSELTLVTFRSTPVERWVSLDSVYQYTFFAQWRRV